VPADDPAPLSTTRLVLLMLGLNLSMFLVALDFVLPHRTPVNDKEYLDNSNSKNYR